ncbi:hypothetical protein EG329_001566 [Mollisiaceae sp. DMI_Dod_QoI]|nr:hypothetical protein EG329_001566 [Helotiales sp. DMI_Dod_QoI]
MINKGSAPRIGFILDFDGTITSKDTISALANFALSFQKSRGRELSGVWDNIITKYSDDYSKHVEKYRPGKEERETLEEEVGFYRSLREIELKSFERVSKSGLFQQIEEQDWKEFGHDAVRTGAVVVRQGFQEFVSVVSGHKLKWGVVSVNFSSHFIKGVLSEDLGAENALLSVLANRSTREGSIIGPELNDDRLCRVLATSDAKLLSMKRLLHHWTGASENENGFSRLIYIGDSGTDIECLTAEGVMGIVVSEDGESDLMKRLKHIGITVVHVDNILRGSQDELYWARNFNEIVGSPLFVSMTKLLDD